MISISYNGMNETVKAAITYVNSLFIYAPFLHTIHAQKQFDMATVSPQKIVQMIEKTDMQLCLDLYWPNSMTRSGYAYDDPLDADTLHLNRLALNRPVHSICNTLVHQCIHSLNARYPNTYFGHGNNKTEGKSKTAPIWIAGIAQKLVAKDDNVFEMMAHENTDNIPYDKQANSLLIQEALYHEGICCVYDVMHILEQG